jgi:hypothetical protein
MNGYVFRYAEFLDSRGEELPPYLLKKLAETPEMAYRWASYLKENNKDVPESILTGILNQTHFAYCPNYPARYARLLGVRGEEIPPKFMKKLLEADPYVIASFAMVVIENGRTPPDVVMNRIKELPEAAYFFIKELIYNKKDIPEVYIQTVAKSPFHSRHLKQLFDNENMEVPSIIRSAASLWNESRVNVPDSIMDRISKSYHYSYLLAVEFTKNNRKVPKEFITRITHSSQHADHYARALIEMNKPVPRVIINAIAREPYRATLFTIFLTSHNKGVPAIIREVLTKKAPSFSYEYLDTVLSAYRDVGFHQSIYNGAINNLAKSNENAFITVKLLSRHGIDIPPKLQKAKDNWIADLNS